MNDPREEKLPRWARELLAKARHRADKAEQRLAEHLETVEPSPIWFGDWQNKLYVPNPFNLGRVNFNLTGQPTGSTFDEVSVDITHDHRLQINGGTSLIIEPHASNHFYVKLREH